MSTKVDQRTETAEVSEPREGSLEDRYVRHAPEALRLAYLLTSDAALAEDITQEAFIRVAGRFRHLRTPDSFDAYLRRTVVNLCMSHHRRRRVERAYLEREGGRQVRAVEPPDVAGARRAPPGARRAPDAAAGRGGAPLLRRPAGATRGRDPRLLGAGGPIPRVPGDGDAADHDRR